MFAALPPAAYPILPHAAAGRSVGSAAFACLQCRTDGRAVRKVCARAASVCSLCKQLQRLTPMALMIHTVHNPLQSALLQRAVGEVRSGDKRTCCVKQSQLNPAATSFLCCVSSLKVACTVLGCCLMVLRLSRLCAQLRRRPAELWEGGRGLWQPNGCRAASSAAPAPVESQANQGFVDGGYKVTDFPPDKVPPTLHQL